MSTQHDKTHYLAFLPALLAISLAVSSLAAFVFSTKAHMQQHVDHSLQPISQKLHEHVALPNHPAQSDWTKTLHQRLFSLENKMEQLQVQLAIFQVTLTQHCDQCMRRNTP